MSATLIPSPTELAETASATAAASDTTVEATAGLGGYRDATGRGRTLIAHPGVGGSVLVIDKDDATPTDRRLVAHLAGDEPAVNARVVAELYLADPRGRFARPLDERDWVTLADSREPPDEPDLPAPGELRDARGPRYRLAAVDEHRYGRQTRWLRRGTRGRSVAVTVRTVIGALEAYEPARDLTRAAIARPPSGTGADLLARAPHARAQPAGPQPRAARGRAPPRPLGRAEPVVHRLAPRARQTPRHRPAHRRHHLASAPARRPARGRQVAADAVDPHRRARSLRARRAGRRAPGGRAGLTPPTATPPADPVRGRAARGHRRPPRAIPDRGRLMRLPGTLSLKGGRPGRWCRVVACDLHAPALDVESVVGPLPEPASRPAPSARGAHRVTPRSRVDELAPRQWFALLEPDRPISDYGYARCPLHDDHIPSLKLYDEPRDGWYCWACARGGDIVEYAAWRWCQRSSRSLDASEFRELVDRLHRELGTPATPRAP